MTTRAPARARAGLVLILVGLAVQAGASFLWTPGTFIISAAVGVPLVAVGTLLALLQGGSASAAKVASVRGAGQDQRAAERDG